MHSRRNFAVPFVLLTAAIPGRCGPLSPDGSGDDGGDPVVSFVAPADGTVVTEHLEYGSIQVRASDPDAGPTDGDGIRSVKLVVTNAETGEYVTGRTERWSTYDFGPDLPDGVYLIEATARSRRSAGGESTTTAMTLTVDLDGSAPFETAPPETAPPETAPPETAPPETAPPETAPPETAPPEVGDATGASLAALNATRANAGLAPVALNSEMSGFALSWSQEMSSSGFRHSDGPYAENIAWTSDDSLSAAAAGAYFNDAWVNSPGHFANMTNPNWTEVGIGLHRESSGWWATHVFR
jgi:uncharacterized protein YkwD